MKRCILLLVGFIFLQTLHSANKTFSPFLYTYEERVAKTRGFGGWSIAKELFNHIRKILPEGGALLELGSGWTSGEFSKYYTVYSIEHDPFFLNKYNVNYIYAPIVGNWYDPDVLAAGLPEDYDVILVDGPVGNIGRYDLLTYFHLFRQDVPIIVDDVNRKEEHHLMIDLAAMLKRPYEVYTVSSKQYAIIY